MLSRLFGEGGFYWNARHRNGIQMHTTWTRKINKEESSLRSGLLLAVKQQVDHADGSLLLVFHGKHDKGALRCLYNLEIAGAKHKQTNQHEF